MLKPACLGPACFGAFALGLVVLSGVAAPAVAQEDPPARIGNVWNHRDHQPTQGEVTSREERGASTDAPSGSRADGDLRRIQRSIDQQEASHPPGWLDRSNTLNQQ